LMQVFFIIFTKKDYFFITVLKLNCYQFIIFISV